MTLGFLDFQVAPNLPHFDSPWNRDLDAVEHVHHCQRGKATNVTDFRFHVVWKITKY